MEKLTDLQTKLAIASGKLKKSQTERRKMLPERRSYHAHLVKEHHLSEDISYLKRMVKRLEDAEREARIQSLVGGN